MLRFNQKVNTSLREKGTGGNRVRKLNGDMLNDTDFGRVDAGALYRKVNATEKKVKEAKYVPTMEECWEEIANSKASDSDKRKCLEVKEYMEKGLIGREPVPEGKKQKKFTKAEALRLHKQLQEIRREEILEELVAKTPDNYILVVTEEDLTEMRRTAEAQSEIGYDTETTGLDKYKDKIVGHCVYCPEDDKSFYLPFRHTTGEVQLHDLEVNNTMSIILNKVPKKILHNANYDIHMCLNDKLPITGEWHCTQTIAHMFNENEMSHGLKQLTEKYLKIPSDKYATLFGNGGFEGVPLKYARYYGANDPKITYELYKFYEGIALAEGDLYGMKRIWNEYLEVEMPLIKVNANMERVGFVINEKHMGQQSIEYGKEIDRLEKEIKEVLGKDVLLSSPPQLLKALQSKVSKDIKGTGKKILKPLKAQFPVVGKLLEWRGASKLKNDFMDKLPNFYQESTRRYHSNFKPRGTVTSRFSSVEFNAQQIHKIIRQSFEAPNRMVIVSADFGGQENRWLGHFCQDEKMKEGWAKGIDFYSSIASSVFNKHYEDCRDGTQWRNLAKVIVLAVTYGISPVELGFTILTAKYADQGIKREPTKEDATKEGKTTIRLFLDAFPRIEPWMKQTQKMAQEKSYVLMEFGNKRRLPLPKEVYMEESRNIVAVDKMRSQGYDLEARRKGKDILIPWNLLPDWKKKSIKGGIDRQAVNSVIQGTSAEQTKRVMIQSDKWCKHKRSQGREFYLLAPIHDELLFYAPDDITEEEILWIEKLMTQTVTLEGIDVVTDIAVGKNWKDMISYKEYLESQEEWNKLWSERNWMTK